eukprot:2325818-Amphidinium_carterae.1
MAAIEAQDQMVLSQNGYGCKQRTATCDNREDSGRNSLEPLLKRFRHLMSRPAPAVSRPNPRLQWPAPLLTGAH